MPYDEPPQAPASTLDRLDERVENLRRVVKDFTHQAREQMQVQESAVRLILKSVDELKNELEDVSEEARSAHSISTELKKKHDEDMLARAVRRKLVNVVWVYGSIAFGGIAAFYSFISSGALRSLVSWLSGALGPPI